MNALKKLDRVKQWAGEKMGGEVKTSNSDDFKAMELEMNLRHEGLERLQKSMTTYVKAVARRDENASGEKMLAVGYLGQSMVSHGQDFNHDSEFGSCLIGMGRVNEQLARKQEAYVAHATTTWLESLERGIVQMKEYQVARKKLEQRRLGYDASLAKMQKAKKEDFRVEEELRCQKAKYEEASEDVWRRMEDVREGEADTVADLTAFLESELAYYQNCADMLQKLRREWPAGTTVSRNANSARARSNTTHSYADRVSHVEPDNEPRHTIPSRGNGMSASRDQSNERSISMGSARPAFNRSVTNEFSNSTTRDFSPGPVRVSRVPTEPLPGLTGRAQLRPIKPRAAAAENVFNDKAGVRDDDFNERSDSPTSYGSVQSRAGSYTDMGRVGSVKKAPPPPPPSRAKKPAPPPPPMKRSALSSSQMPGY